MQATEIWEGERKYPVTVRLRADQRAGFASIGRILIDTPRGQRIPLDDVATLSVRGGRMNRSLSARPRYGERRQ